MNTFLCFFRHFFLPLLDPPFSGSALNASQAGQKGGRAGGGLHALMGEGWVKGGLPGPYHTRLCFSLFLHVNGWSNGQQPGEWFQRAGVRISVKSKKEYLLTDKHFEKLIAQKHQALQYLAVTTLV